MCTREVYALHRRKVIRSEIFPAARAQWNATLHVRWCKAFLFPAARFPRLLVTQRGRTSFWTNRLCRITFQWHAFGNNNGTSCHRPRKLSSYAHAAMKNRIREHVKLEGLAGTHSPLLLRWLIFMRGINFTLIPDKYTCEDTGHSFVYTRQISIQSKPTCT